jgi:predicted acylesterase/phospholipase RssA
MPAPPTALEVASPVGFGPDVRFASADQSYFDAHVDQVIARFERVARERPPNVIAFSGGGAGGAFGAGVLEGMSRSGDRPTFDLVTGVSVGALIAPFAFLGPDWDAELRDAFIAGRSAHLMRRRFASLLYEPSLYRGEPLVDLVDHFVTDRMVGAVADQARGGRQLLVATTNLDTQQTVIWDLGAIALRGGPAARRLFRDVLVASASIPGIFPPVRIRVTGGGREYEELHVDGGTSAPFFVASEIAHVASGRFRTLASANLYVVINGQLLGQPKSTSARITTIVARSFATEQMHGSRRALELTDAFARANGMNLRFASIPVTYPYSGPLNFKPELMQALFGYAAACTTRGSLWMSLAEAAADAQHVGRSALSSPDECPRRAGGSERLVDPVNGRRSAERSSFRGSAALVGARDVAQP